MSNQKGGDHERPNCWIDFVGIVWVAGVWVPSVQLLCSTRASSERLGGWDAGGGDCAADHLSGMEAAALTLARLAKVTLGTFFRNSSYHVRRSKIG
jgi:hypothetical protein